MPLTNDVIIKLNEITTNVEDKNSLKESEIEDIKKIFKNILEQGQTYNVEEIESWFDNEGSWKNKKSIIRIINLAHYTQSKFEQTDRFRVLSNDDSCSCS